jgi:hypothetical protein
MRGLLFILLVGVTGLSPRSHAQDRNIWASAEPDKRVPIRFVHVDTEDVAGQRLAAAVENGLKSSAAVRSEEGSVLVVWFRTLTIPAPFVSGIPLESAIPFGVAYSIVIDLDGRHWTDNLGFAQTGSFEVTAESIVKSLDEMAREIADEGVVAVN